MKTIKPILLSALIGLMLVLSSQYALADAYAYRQKIYGINEKYYSLLKYGTAKSLSYSDNSEIRSLGTRAVDACYTYMYSKATASQRKTLDNYYISYRKEINAAESLLTAEEKAEKFKRSEYGQLILPIFEKIAKFAEKGVYEKTADYEQRMKNQLLDSAMNWSKRLSRYYFKLKVTNVSEKYNADEEKATLLIQSENGQVNFFQTIVPLNIDNAKKLVSFSTFSNSGEADDFMFDLTNVLKLIHGDKVFPDSISFNIFNNGRFTYKVTAPANMDLKDIIIDFSGIENAGKYLKGYGYNVTANQPVLPQPLKGQLIARISEVNQQIEEKINKINSDLLSYQYNVNQRIMISEGKKKRQALKINNYYTIDSIEKRYSTLMNDLEEFEANGAKKMIRDELYRSNPDTFMKITYELYPELKKQTEKDFRNYMCNYSEAEYVKNLIDSVEMKGDCKNKFYAEYKDLFDSSQQFDHVFNSTTDFMAEIDKRKEGKRIYEQNRQLFDSKQQFDSIFYSTQNIQKVIEQRKADKLYRDNIELFANRHDFDSAYTSSANFFNNEIERRKKLKNEYEQFKIMVYFEKNTPDGTEAQYGYAGITDFEDVYTKQKREIDTNVQLFLTLMSDLRKSMYATAAMKYFFEWNKYISKEYPKVEQFFNGYWDFWDHYSSSDYKQYLKEQKKKMKSK